MKRSAPIILLSAILFYGMFNGSSVAQTWQADGNIKYRLVNTAYSQDSVFRDLSGSNAIDHGLSARVNLKLNLKKWSAESSYQLIGLYGDTLESTRDGTEQLLFRSPVQNDDSRLLDLTQTYSDQGDYALVHRLDRFSLAYQGEFNVVKLGRQAVSWGNGLIYTPMDFLNPFDPTAIDTEYKPGEDMLYAQHLFSNGNDLQAVWVIRRSQLERTTRKVNSVAMKYHGFFGASEIDLLLAEHYQDTIIGVGGTISVGGSVLRGDWVITNTDQQRFHNVVVNISYSWRAWNKNVSGSFEYFHNDFGVRANVLSLKELSVKPDLLNRVGRGELFTLGRDYLAASAVIEMAPLWLLTSNTFYNYSDNSALTQLVSQHDLTQNTQLMVALSTPIGSPGTEFGGFSVISNSEQKERLSSSRWSIYAQLAWYF